MRGNTELKGPVTGHDKTKGPLMGHSKSRGPEGSNEEGSWPVRSRYTRALGPARINRVWSVFSRLDSASRVRALRSCGARMVARVTCGGKLEPVKDSKSDLKKFVAGFQVNLLERNERESWLFSSFKLDGIFANTRVVS